jgi:hypothetical protein
MVLLKLLHSMRAPLLHVDFCQKWQQVSSPRRGRRGLGGFRLGAGPTSRATTVRPLEISFACRDAAARAWQCGAPPLPWPAPGFGLAAAAPARIEPNACRSETHPWRKVDVRRTASAGRQRLRRAHEFSRSSWIFLS